MEILGEIKEPLATPLLSDISVRSEAELQEAARGALAQINSSGLENRTYLLLRRSQLTNVLGSALLIGLLLSWIFGRIRKGVDTQLLLLSVVPIALVGGMSWMVAGDFREGIVDNRSLGRAIANRNITALKTMNYHDYTVYPGDSYVARRLVSIGDDKVISAIVMLPTCTNHG